MCFLVLEGLLKTRDVDWIQKVLMDYCLSLITKEQAPRLECVQFKKSLSALNNEKKVYDHVMPKKQSDVTVIERLSSNVFSHRLKMGSNVDVMMQNFRQGCSLGLERLGLETFFERLGLEG